MTKTTIDYRRAIIAALALWRREGHVMPPKFRDLVAKPGGQIIAALERLAEDGFCRDLRTGFGKSDRCWALSEDKLVAKPVVALYFPSDEWPMPGAVQRVRVLGGNLHFEYDVVN